MSPEDIVQVLPAAELKAKLIKYLDDRLLNRAESSDMAWSRRLLLASFSLLGGQQMSRGELSSKVGATLLDAPSSYYKELYVEDLVEAISTLVMEAPPATPSEN